MNIATYTAKRIKNEGIKHCLVIPGSYVLPLCDAFSREGIELILLDREESIGTIADGYYKEKGTPLSCIATSGPGAARLGGGLQVPYEERSPLIALTGSSPLSSIGRGCMQEASGINSFNQTKFLAEVTKLSKFIGSSSQRIEEVAEEFPVILDLAIEKMYSFPRGPVNLTIPIDVLNSQIEHAIEKTAEIQTHQKNSIDYNKICEDISSSKRPLLIAGGGLDFSFSDKFQEFIDKSGIPVATTLRGKGIIDELHPLSLGCIGLYGQKAARAYLRDSNLIIVLGARLGETTTDCWDSNLFKGKNMIFINHQSSAFQDNPLKSHLKKISFIEEDAGVALSEISKSYIGKKAELNEKIAVLKRKYNSFAEIPSSSLPLDPLEVIDELRKATHKLRELGEEVSIVSESITWTERYLPCSPKVRHITDGNGASLGYGSAAVGIKLANPKKKVIAIVGDGGFRYSVGTLETSLKYNLPVIWIVLNNGCYGAIKQAQENLFDKNFVCSEFGASTNLESIARGYGVFSKEVISRNQLYESLNQALKSNQTSVLDVHVKESCPPIDPSILSLVESWGFKINAGASLLLKARDILNG